MKKKIKLFLSGVLISTALLAGISTYSQPTVTFVPTTATTSLSPGAIVKVDVVVSSAVNIGSFAILVNYNRDALKFDTAIWSSAVQSAPGGGLWSSNGKYKALVSPFDSVARISWAYFGSAGVSCTLPQVICTMNFTFKGGATGSKPISFYAPNAIPNGTRIQSPPPTYNYSTVWSGTVPVSGSVVTLNSVAGGGDWATASTWQENVVPHTGYNVVITGSTVTDASATGRCNNLTINSGGQLTLAATGSLTPAGTFTINSGGSFINNKGSALTATVKRTMTGNWVPFTPQDPTTIWHTVSSPVLTPSNSLFTGCAMNKWNETTQYWEAMTLPFENMALGKGYIVAPNPGGITATFTGTMNTAPKTIGGLTRTESNDALKRGFNLIGNPFASAIKWGSDITRTGITDFAWVSNGSAYLSLSWIAGTGHIPAEQGFFVQVSTAPGSVAIASAALVHSSQAFHKSNLSDLLTLKIEGNGYWDQTQIRVLPESSETYNMEYDAVKFTGSEIAPQLFSYKQDVSLSMLSMPAMVTNAIVPLGLQPGAAGNFTITASDMETFESNTEFFLEDLVANKVQDLKINPVYAFDAAPGQPEHRFNLHFASVGMPEGSAAGSVKIYSSEKTVYVNITSDISGKIVIYNMLGSEIATRTIQSGSLNKISLDVPSGFYLVKVDGSTYTTAGKVFIK